MPFALEDGRPRLDKSALRRASATIGRRITEAGSLDFIAHVLQRVAGTYDVEQARLHLGERPRLARLPAPTPLPVGFLLHLAVKTAHEPATRSNDPGKSADAAIELAQALVDSLDLQSFWPMAALHQTHDSLLPFLRQRVLHDAAYTIVQTRPADVARTVEALFRWVSPTRTLGSGWTVGEFVAVVEVLIETLEPRGPQVVDVDYIQARLRHLLSDAKVRVVLDDCAHPSGVVNAEFFAPTDPTTFGSKPLLRVGEKLVIADPAWCAPAFFEVVRGALRGGSFGPVTRSVGSAFESLVRAELESHGVTGLSGRLGPDEHECDVIVETSDAVILLELKTKSLRRGARAGDPVEMLVDLSESLFEAQEQLAVRELAMTRAGSLELSSDAGRHTITLGDRTIERIAVTHQDYGRLQDRQMLSGLLHLLSDATLSGPPEWAEKFGALERRAHSLGTKHHELIEVGACSETNPFHHCWFLSLGHLRVILDHVESNDSFWRELKRTRSVSFGTSDFYFEYAEARRLSAGRRRP